MRLVRLGLHRPVEWHERGRLDRQRSEVLFLNLLYARMRAAPGHSGLAQACPNDSRLWHEGGEGVNVNFNYSYCGVRNEEVR